MALTITRWIVAALVGCAALAGWALREGPAPIQERPIDREAELLSRAGSARLQLVSAIARLRTVAVRDSLVAHPPSVAKGSVVVSDHSAREQWSERRNLPTVLAEAAAERPAHPVMPVELAVVYDTGGWVRPRANVDYLLPGSGFSDRCTAVVELGAADWRKLPRAEALLGPCAYYEAFGRPGPAIDRWLRARGWMFGRVVSWTHPRPWHALVEGRFSARDFAAFDTLARHTLSITAERCAAGDVGQCQVNVLEGEAGDAAPVWGAGFMSASLAPTQFTSRNLWLGPAQGMLLSEMVRTLGPERFAQFWRSDLDPARAFRAAAGVSLGECTRDWMQREYGKQTRGPTVNYAGAGLTGIILLVGLALGLRAVQTRNVG